MPEKPNHSAINSENTAPDFAIARGRKEFQDMVEAYLPLMNQLEDFREVVERYRKADPDIQLPEFAEALSYSPVVALTEIEMMMDAFGYIESGAPAAADPFPQLNIPAPWATPVSLPMVREIAETARSGERGFREQNEANRAQLRKIKEWKRSGERKVNSGQSRCGRPTKAGGRCEKRAVTWPGKPVGPACRLHLTRQELAEVHALYDVITDTTDCRGCNTPAGKGCTVAPSRQATVNGAYSGLREIKPKKIHQVRIDDYLDALGENDFL